MKKNTKLLLFVLTINVLLQLSQVQAKVDPRNSAAPAESAIHENKQNISDEEKSFKTALTYIGSAHELANLPDREKLLSNARDELTNAVSKNKNYLEAIYFRGVVNLMMGKLDEGETDLLRAIEINPKTAEAHYNLACLYSVRNNTELALASLDNALKNGFKDTDYLFHDPDLAFLRSIKEFNEILAKNNIF